MKTANPLRQKITRKSAVKGRLWKPQQIPSPLKLRNLGESWPDGITVVKVEKISAPDHAIRTGVIITTIVLCSALFIAVTVEAMVVGDRQRLDSVLRFAEWLMVALIGWATTTTQWQKARDVLKKAKNAFQILKE